MWVDIMHGIKVTEHKERASLTLVGVDSSNESRSLQTTSTGILEHILPTRKNVLLSKSSHSENVDMNGLDCNVS